MDNYNFYADDNSGKKGLAVASLVLGILAFITCCAFINMPLAIISIVLAVISLIKKHGGKGLSIAGLVLSGISLLVSLYMLVTVPFGLVFDFIEHSSELVNNGDQIVREYKEDNTIPEWLQQYDPEFVKQFMDAFAEGYSSSGTGTSIK